MFGTVFENEIVDDHKIMCPPNIYGKIVKVRSEAVEGDGSWAGEAG